ncbi:hypothetical protein AJ78_02465 [Emergomyces pasteurianus Ep9510]|uniref:Uncharacterized protein n=1 Tax=Emergomyces pasteurianus Ep9510 TaxID=1447872 RepID=A0A1J9PLQ2_9EURO|nr:hypothetical protein AJ78_02465 [Emergomyces pasteurianus Ep9510]
MTFSESPMPGAFILDSPIPPKLDLAGARSQFYRSPQTPSAASSLYRSVGSEHQGSRKRARYGYRDVVVDGSAGKDPSSPFTTTTAATSAWGDQSMMTTATSTSSLSLSHISSPTPLVNTDYRFAGGVDSSMMMLRPSGQEKPSYDENGPEVDYRPNRYQEMTHAPMDGQSLGSLSPVVIGGGGGGGRDVNGNGTTRKRGRRESLLSTEQDGSPDYHNNTGGWGSTVVKIVGGVAGKVWDFCWSGPFRGFYAGGGKGYGMESDPQRQSQPSPPPRAVDAPNAWQKVYEKDDVFSSSSGRRENGAAIVPGHFPTESKHHDEIQGNWVLVRNANSKDAPVDDMSPSSTHSSARRVLRNSNAIHHPHPVTPRRVAVGRLARRQPLITPARPSSSSSSHNHHHYHQLSSSNGKASREAVKSGSPTKFGSSPASIEAQRFAARAKRREREEDASIRRLNQQLKAMIKEGKEALGTTIEIEGDGMDMEDWD